MNKNGVLFYAVPPTLLVLLTGIFYGFSVNYQFQFDDLANIVQNFQVRSGGLAEIFFSSTRWISQSLNTLYFQIGKFEPFVYRFANITSHILAGLTVYFVVWLMLRRLKPDQFLYVQRFSVAFLTAGLFLLHPAQSQTVSYIIQGQLEGLAALITLSMILFFLIFVSVKTTAARLTALAFLYLMVFLAPGTKEIAIISPLLVFLVDWFFVAQGSVRSLKRRWWLHLTICAAIFGMYTYFLKPEYFTTILGMQMELNNNMGNMLTGNIGDKITPLWYCMSQFKVILHYMGIFFWPFAMSVDYDWVLVEHFFSLDCILPFLMLVLLGCYTLYRLHGNKIHPFGFGILWFFICILPRSSIIPSTELVADYKTYLAAVGLLFLWACALAYGLAWVEKRLNLGQYYALHWLMMLSLLLPVGYGLYTRNKVWRTAQEFWLNILQNAPRKARAYNNYGVSLCATGQNQEAIPYFKKAMELDVHYSDPHNNIAVAYGCLNRLDEAIAELEKSVSIFPVQPEAYNNMASFYLQKKEYAKTEELLRIALRLRPYYGKAHFNMGRMYEAIDKKEQAWECYRTACFKADFDSIDAFAYYVSSCMGLKKYDDALIGYKKILELSPDNIECITGMANCYLLKNEPKKAVPLVKYLMQKNAQNMDLQMRYADILAAAQEYQLALEIYSKVLTANRALVPAYVRVAGCLYHLGRRPEAFQVIENFLAQNPPAEYAEPVKAILASMKDGTFK